MPRVILGFEDAEAVAQFAAHEFVRRARAAIEARGAFKVALAGGSTPRRTFELLAQPTLASAVDWGATHVFFGDERSVPPGHPDSNFNTARLALLAHVPVPDSQVHRMTGENADLKQAAREYEDTIARVFAVPKGSVLPRFDLVLLGMGKDGHTASLFPHTKALTEARSWVVDNDVPAQKTQRLTLTATLINAARCVVFLVAGGDKKEPLRSVLEGARDEAQFPSQMIAPTEGDLVWLVDRAAAANLAMRPEVPQSLPHAS
jgi:6-phosphogluconolactonase